MEGDLDDERDRQDSADNSQVSVSLRREKP